MTIRELEVAQEAGEDHVVIRVKEHKTQRGGAVHLMLEKSMWEVAK